MQYFITATGTNIGKTFILENACRKLIEDGKKVEAIKPIISGFSDDDLESDSAKILNILGQELNKKNLDSISPYRFLAPLSPNIAAKIENRNINFLELTKFCQNKIDINKQNNGYLLIEGAGGVMTPITNNKTFADLILALKIPAILVAGNYLGTLSHTLTAIMAMQSYKIDIIQVVLNCLDSDTIDAKDTLESLRSLTNIPISNKLSLRNLF